MPDILTAAHRLRPWFLEIFAGKAWLTRAMKKACWSTLPPVEINVGGDTLASADLLDPALRRKRQAAQAKKASARAGGGDGAAQKAKAKASPKGSTALVVRGSDSSKPKVPAAEWSQLIALKAQPQVAKKCKFFNCSLGCKLANCKQQHVCLLCGEAHSWADVHFK